MTASTPKRVLIFSLNYYPRFVGGAEVAIKEITDRVSSEEVVFHMVTLRFDSTLPKVEQIGNVLVHRIGFATRAPSIADLRKFPLRLTKFLFQFLAVAKAVELHAKYRYALTWGMMAHACGIPAGIFKMLNPNVPYLLTLQEGDPPEVIMRSMRFVWPLFRQGFLQANALQAISTFLARWGTHMGFRGTPEVIPNGVDLERFSRTWSESELSVAREKIGKQAGHTVLITASRLVHKNAVDDVIRALALLPDTVSFAVCGIGPDEEKLRALAEELKVTHRMRWLGEVPHTELPLMLAASDVFIRPSRSEGMGNAFVEAMAVGMPVIGSDAGGIPDFLTDTTGFPVPVNSADTIVERVRFITDHPEEARATALRGQALVRERYGWVQIADEMEALMKRLIA